MPTLRVSVSTRRATDLLSNVAKQLPYAVSTMANDLAFQVQRAERAAMPQVFKSPRPFTANSVVVTRATKSSPTATVFIRPEVAKYLQPYETGGMHVLPGAGNALLNPKDINLDQSGQLPRRMTAQLNARKDVFVGPITTKDGQTINGFWQRLDVTRQGNARRKRRERGTIFSSAHGALKLLIRFGDALPVHKHLDFRSRASTVVAANAGPAFARALAKALATAR
jgi:hypothetical protein